ncbi:MAG: outer-membrane lipoprotein carrier protein LolA [Pseudomonadota bacterium]
MTGSFFKTLKRAAMASLVGGALAVVSGVLPSAGSLAQAKVNGKDREAVQKISRYFSGVPSMTGEFIQFGPNGEQTGGKFYLKRPGRIRFDYAKPSPITVKADGRTVGINNRKLKTWDFFPLRKTPLRMLLADSIDVNDKAIKEVRREADLTTVILGDKSVFGNSKITLMFDPSTYELRQWTITDDQGKDTSVMIFNVQNNVKLSQKLFRMNQRQLLQQQNNRFNNDR